MNYLVAVDDCFIDVPGGMGRVAWDIALLMRDRHHDVTMLCTRKSAHAPDTSEVDGIRILRYDKPSLAQWHPRRAEHSIAAAAAAAHKLNSKRWDIVHMHSIFTGLGAMRAFEVGPRYIYTMHSPVVLEQCINWRKQGVTGRLKLLFGQGKLKRLEAEILTACAAIHTLSEFTKRQVQEFHGLADRVTVIPHWRRPEYRRTLCKSEARRRLGWPKDEIILFTLRHHGPRYGLDIAINAIAPLTGANRCRFIIGGDGPLRPALQALAGRLNAGDRILFPGRLSDEQVALAYQAADLFILPTLALECFGLITLEAFAYGCPVLSSDACAIPETMRPIMPDFIVPAGNVEALSRKVSDFLDGRLIPPSSEQLVEYVVQRFDHSIVAPKIIGLLEGTGKP